MTCEKKPNTVALQQFKGQEGLMLQNDTIDIEDFKSHSLNTHRQMGS